MAQDTKQSLSTRSARNLATTTKSVPQMEGITPRYLLQALPWVDLEAGTYRVNQLVRYTIGDKRINISFSGDDPRIVAEDLRELPFLRGADSEILAALADSLVAEVVEAGTVLTESETASRLYIIASGRVERHVTSAIGERAFLDVVSGGDFFDTDAFITGGAWAYEAKTATRCQVFVLERHRLDELAEREPAFGQQLAAFQQADRGQDGEASIGLTSGHVGEPLLPRTFVDYQDSPREYELSLAQTTLQLHTRVSDLFNEPMNQYDQQVRLTIEAVREEQENELFNNPDFGLLNNVALSQRIHTRSGPPTPDDLDDLLRLVWKKPAFFLAHPAAIAAFGRECTLRGVPPVIIDLFGSPMITWRGVPLLPTDKIPLNGGMTGTTSILLMRVGENEQGVIGLRPAQLEGESEPGLTVKPMGVDQRGITSFLVSAYFSNAILVNDAIAMLENVEVSKYHDYR